MSDSLWVIVDGETKGPFAPHEIEERIREGQMPSDVLCAREGDEEWRAWDGVPPSLRAAARGGEDSNAGVISFAIGMAAVALLVGLIVFAAAGDDATSVAEKYVSSHIVGPHKVVSVKQVGGDVYRVTIDGLNGFGGPVRSAFDVTVKGLEVKEMVASPVPAMTRMTSGYE